MVHELRIVPIERRSLKRRSEIVSIELSRDPEWIRGENWRIIHVQEPTGEWHEEERELLSPWLAIPPIE
jgi:hypothetical protein